MKLEPIAKPIRIRIKLGDSEHSSLDSLKSNFSIKELFPLFKDGRLERWLRQIGEAQLAHRVEDFSKQCGEGEIKDYIQFLSLFFDEVADALAAYESDGKWSIKGFLSTASLDAIKIIYANTKDFEDEEDEDVDVDENDEERLEEKINWANYIGIILSKENVFSIFEDSQLHTVYDNDIWGIKLSKLVETNDDYKKFFRFVGTEVKNNPEYKDVFESFYYATYNLGYVWESIFGTENLHSILEWYSNDIFVKVSKQDWKAIIRPHLTVDNIKEVFNKYPNLYEDNWGAEFARVVTDEKQYKDLFNYLEKHSRNSSQTDKWKHVISTFINVLTGRNYKWDLVFKNELSIEYLKYIYQNENVRTEGDIDWGKLFADCVTDWNNESVQIENIIKCNGRDITSFYKRCVENGFEEAKMKLEPWDCLANSDDYQYVKEALENWDGDHRKYYRGLYNYDNITSPLGKQILDFLQSLIDLRGKNGSWGEVHNYGCDYYLEDEKKVMIAVRQRYREKSGFWTFKKDDSALIFSMVNRVRLAKYAWDKELEGSYLDIAKYAVKQIANKLKKRRR